MKKRTVANTVMVAVIALVLVAGVAIVGAIRGWFDSADGNAAVLGDVRGTVLMERSGVVYTVESDTVLRSGDRVTASPGSGAVIRLNDGKAALNGSVKMTVSDPSADRPEWEVEGGEVFVHCTHPLRLVFAGRGVTVEQAVVFLSVREGAQTLGVFRGSAEDANAGYQIEYVDGVRSVREMKIENLNDFLIAQIRETNKTDLLCYTDGALDALEESRRQAIRRLVEDSVPEDHTHAYSVVVTPPDCVSSGYTEYRCECGNSYRTDHVDPAGHVWGNWAVLKAASATEEGVRERTCAVCGQTEREPIGKVEENHVHAYTAEETAPTCTAEGYLIYICRCGESYIDRVLPPTGHQYSVQTVPSTCEAKGYTVHRCACGAAYVDGETPATGHSWGAWNISKETPDQKERVCSVCGKTERQPAVAAPEAEGSVYITIVCHTILDNLGDLAAGKGEFVPSDGVILPTVKVSFYKNETVFDVLKRVCDRAGIQLEYSWTPLYDSYYVEGINHLYEFDCGERSGWMYKVNEWFPNYGASSCPIEDGDIIVWCYTCQGLGSDVGGGMEE